MSGAVGVRDIPGQQEWHDMSPFPSLAGAQSPHYNRKKMTLPSISSKSMSCISNPWSEELINDMTEQAVSLLVCKYKFERNLTKQLGLISVPITETLVDLLLGFKKVKGSNICLSSEVNWNDLLRMLEEAQWARHVSLEASQHDASQHDVSQHTASPQGTSPHSVDTPSILSMPATVLDQVAEEPGPQVPTLQEKGTAEEHKPTNELEPKPSASQSTGTGFKQPEQVVDMGEKQNREGEGEGEEEGEEEEEEEEEEGEEEEEEEGEEEEEDYHILGR
ncbi:Coiled-coil domain-containing protein 116 [Myotis davidii]|uniref:Coiled-coil domain-containing protein 116 n=1 Tax=Myotis davidii TaxID=225400 RepID=L5LK59_MYODS|nr:Coiled-coil domain-containing protein 116 [Myotis davidii]